MQIRCVMLRILAVVCSAIHGKAFNFDVTSQNVRKYSGASESMFGFSVALFKGNTPEENWVLVGAPNGQSSVVNVTRGGVVFRCSVLSYKCIEIPFYAKTNYDLKASEEGIRNFQWLGATVVAAESGDVMMACAPRYAVNITNSYDNIEPVGTCWTATSDFQEFHEYAPCRTSEWQYTHHGYCQAGLGAGISYSGTQLFIGAPGSNLWKGEIMNVNATMHMDFLPPERKIQPTARDPRVYERVYKPPQVYYSGILNEQDTYLGYSVAVGEFYGRGNTSVAVGRPRGSDLAGQVDIFTWDLKLLKHISGDQVGSYFGSSLCACDIDGDGYDDLVIGAPFYTQPDENKYEMGRIYVYLQKNNFESYHSVNGSNSQMRFGFSLSCLGDINKDFYDDIAVGAPYTLSDNSANGQGAVYIYLGSENGITQQPSQTIFANDPDITTFGYSVSGGLDLDNNKYPDLVVGAYEANSAFFFRTRPVVKVNAEVTFNITSRQVDLKNPNCLVEGSNTSCLTIKTCLNYSGIGVHQQLDFALQLLLDFPYNRMYFRDGQHERRKSFTQRASAAKKQCIDFDVYIKPRTINFRALEVEMTYSLKSSGKLGKYPRLVPVLDVHPKTATNTLKLVQNCGSDHICLPKLNMKVNLSAETFQSGLGDFYIIVFLDNKGEDGFNTIYSLKLPKGLEYGGDKRLDDNKNLDMLCIPHEDYIDCYIEDGFPGHQHVEFKIVLQPSYKNLPSNYTSYSLEMSIHSNGIDEEGKPIPTEIKKKIKIPIQVQAVVNLKGSIPIDVLWNSLNYTKSDDFKETNEIGPLVVHEYTIHNDGPADIVEADIILMIPTRTLADDNFLYILEQPETSNKIYCEEVLEANYLKLKKMFEETSFNSSSSLKQSYVSKGDKSKGNRKSFQPLDQNLIYLEDTKEKQAYIKDGSGSKNSEKNVLNRRKRSPGSYQNEKNGVMNQCNTNNLSLTTSTWEEIIECKEMKCTKISCHLLAALGRKEEVLISLRMRVWVPTLKKFNNYRKIETFTKMAVKIKRLPYIDVPEKPIICSHQIFTKVISTDIITVKHSVPLWVIVVSTMSGALILLVIIFLLYKCGFFKRRNRAETDSETKIAEMETVTKESEKHHSKDDKMK